MDLQTFSELFSHTLNNIQFYGFLFLLGSFTVASLSDLKRMAAQKEFAEVWLLFTLAVFVYDFYRLSGEVYLSVFVVKWSIIGLFALFSWKYFGVILSLSEMDLTAACAVMSLLNPLFILTYYLLLVFIKLLLKPFLNKFGDGISTPFMPVILAATVAILFTVRIVSSPEISKILS